MAKQVSKKARVETAFGQTLASPVNFEYSYEELAKGDEIPADEQLTADDVVSYVNQKRNALARSKAQTDALTAAGIEKPTLESADFRLATMIKTLVAAGNGKEQAEQIARQVLNMPA